MSFALCLAGGGVKGAAHIGVLKALQENDIKIDYIGGTSSGSIVATLFAVGYTPDEIYDIFKIYAKKIKYVQFKNILKLILGLIFKRKIIIDGLNSGMSLENLIDKMCNQKSINNISQIKLPLVIPSVDLYNGKVLCFTSYNRNRSFSDEVEFVDDIPIGKAVHASCSYPVIFSPCNYKNTMLIDGGIRENVPWKELKKLGADNILNVTFDEEPNKNCCSNLVDVANRSIELLCRELYNYEMEGADYILKIKSPNLSLLDMSKIDELYNLGYVTAKNNMKKIKEKLKI